MGDVNAVHRERLVSCATVTIYSIHIIGHAVAAVGRQTVKIMVCLRLRVEILHQSVHKGILRVLGKSWTIQKNERRAEP